AAETGAALDALVASGKIRAAGVSNFRPWDWDLLQANMTNPLATNQIELSLSARQSYTNGDLAHAQQHHIRPMAWSPLGGGSLMTEPSAVAGKLDTVAQAQGVDRAAVAVAW
ncbi:oxidoreductase, partial [Puniceicoccales bacterium CK1056]|nr:oxidoreductase [Oceanipulchritudo coccoides]